MRPFWLLCAVAFIVVAPASVSASSPEGTLESARNVLSEIMSIPAKRVPHKMLAEAHGVVIVPSVIKIGFIAGVRRGRGVVLVRDGEGDWGLPQFITLTGGSVGWQAGAQATDVILVFRSKKSVEGLMRGKFTIGADAAAAAGPVGRNVEAATDGQLKAEILSYSRSRGLFAGVSLDGSALQVDEAAHQQCYGSPSSMIPAQIPESATRLVTALGDLGQSPEKWPEQSTPAGEPTPAGKTADQLRTELANASQRLQPLLDETWRRYLALPAEVYQPGRHPAADIVRRTLDSYESVAKNPQYRALSSRAEFQALVGLLQQYAAALAPIAGEIELPPPPPGGPVLSR